MTIIRYILITSLVVGNLSAFTEDVKHANTILTKVPLFRISDSDTLNSASFIHSFGKNYNQSEITLNMYRKPLLITTSGQYLFNYEYVYQNLNLSYIYSDLNIVNIIAGYSFHFGFFNATSWNTSKLHTSVNSSFRYINNSIEKYIIPTISADLGFEYLVGNNHTYKNNYMYLDITGYLELFNMEDLPIVMSYKIYPGYQWFNIGIKYIF